MKVLLVSDAGSIHTKRWASSLEDAGLDMVLFSITPADEDWYCRKGIKIYVFDLFGYKKKKNSFKKKKNLVASLTAHAGAVRALRTVIRKEKPDILHAHYATSYGLVAALSGFHPFVVSVWGSDIYEFPRQSAVNRMAVKYILGRADRVLSTSCAMAAETARYCRGDIGITPFGVDTDIFRKLPESRNDGCIVFGTVKTLSRKYGIDILLKAFARMSSVMAGTAFPVDTRLVIAGKGPDMAELERLASKLGIASAVDFIGEVSHEDVPAIYSGLDVAVFLSREESFGVSAVEAMACEVPVIASDADGFREVLDGGAGIVVPREDPDAAARAMLKLAVDAGARRALGKRGREKVCRCYEWRSNVRDMIAEYEAVLSNRRSRTSEVDGES